MMKYSKFSVVDLILNYLVTLFDGFRFQFTEVKMFYFCYIYLVLTLTTKANSNIFTDSLTSSAKIFTKTFEQILNMPNSMTTPLCSLKTVIKFFLLDIFSKLNNIALHLVKLVY